MKKAAPGARNKIWGDALTKWNVNWHYGLTQIPGGCRVNNVTTSVQVTFIMPRWKNRADGSQELREKWDKYLKALQKHENGHKAHGINAAEEIESEIKSLRQLNSCYAKEEIRHQVHFSRNIAIICNNLLFMAPRQNAAHRQDDRTATSLP